MFLNEQLIEQTRNENGISRNEEVVVKPYFSMNMVKQDQTSKRYNSILQWLQTKKWLNPNRVGLQDAA